MQLLPRVLYVALQLLLVPLVPWIGMAHAQTGSISGVVRLFDCTAQSNEVIISAGGKTTAAVRDPGSEGLFRYRISGLVKGEYRVAARLAHDRCPGGSWNPAARTVRLNPPQASTRQDFEYRLPRQLKRISGDMLASLMTDLFRGTALTLNNYGPRHDETWQKSDDSVIRLGPMLGGFELRFDLPEIKGRAGRRYYIRDIGLSRLTVVTASGAVRLLLEEERGGTLEGRCLDDIACFGAAEDPAPDFHVPRARLEIELVPSADASGSIAFGAVRAAFVMVVETRGSAEPTDGLRLIYSAIEAIARQALDQPSVKERAAQALRPALTEMRIGSVLSARMQGEDLLLEVAGQ
ncbi:MAG: hypothetical protein ACJ8F3_13225 [Xanthobacteraceae bacterium]